MRNACRHRGSPLVQDRVPSTDRLLVTQRHRARRQGEADRREHRALQRLVGDLALVKAWKGDALGNLVFRKTARNFNPAVAMAGKMCIVEVEEIVEVGEIAPDDIHLAGIYVHRIVLNATPEKRIEKRTITEKAGV